VEKEESFEAYIGTDWVEVPAGTRTVQVMEEVPNTQSKEDFLRQVYEWVIINDISNEIIRYFNQQAEPERIAKENAIREAVAKSITSSVE
jgi:phosphopantetheinyl transferase (holo-ACP synthase)